MAETSNFSVIARTTSDVSAMKETLRVQQLLLQKLYAELDEEREASASAASEALDMILRLQGEKAAVKMEACHYKRMAEERMCHSEATLEELEEVVYHKEMEIASLEFQVQAYKHKLLSLGCDFSASELEFPEDLILNGNDQLNGEKGQCNSNIRRMHSLPPIQFKSSMKFALKNERSPSPVSEVIPEVILESSDQEVNAPNLDLRRKLGDFAYGSGNLDSYWNQIKMLDEKVKVISDCAEGENSSGLISRRGRSSSIFSLANTMITNDQKDRLQSTNSDRKEDANPPCSPNVHDVFEVPQASEKHEITEQITERVMKRLEKWKSEADNRLTKPDSVSEGMVESSLRHDAGKQKGVVRVHREIKAPSFKDMVTTNGLKKERTGVECNVEAEFQKLHERIERLERERINARNEITHEGNGEEQLKLLKDVQNQLNSIQSEMKSWKTKEATPKKPKSTQVNTVRDRDDVSLSLLQLQEAMLHFWL